MRCTCTPDRGALQIASASYLRTSHPGITCDLLMGDYAEVESWITGERVDMGTLRASVPSEFEHASLLDDEHIAVVPKKHPLALASVFPLSTLRGIRGIFSRNGDGFLGGIPTGAKG